MGEQHPAAVWPRGGRPAENTDGIPLRRGGVKAGVDDGMPLRADVWTGSGVGMPLRRGGVEAGVGTEVQGRPDAAANEEEVGESAARSAGCACIQAGVGDDRGRKRDAAEAGERAARSASNAVCCPFGSRDDAFGEAFGE